ncbi:MAG TPA: class I SAM-dependent methyltransferase [Fimbriimonadaceae bacterium]|nr:class I SAM-dependent methyltransferase [Fimbriimonadaceae bacterium]HRJ32988.1 class I SAM-dependent methyltransferase [Fimbriimonadaceae bacterium]
MNFRRRLHRWLTGLQAKKGLSREYLSFRTLRGSGLEIGPLHDPLPVRVGTKVTYVDRMNLPDLRQEYPELKNDPIQAPDVLDNGETLSSFADESQDFLIANHFLEHTEDPFRALQTFARVLRPQGWLFLALPNKEETFDAGREVTPLAHLIEDYHQGPQGTRESHYQEWVAHVEKVEGFEERVRRAAQLDQQNYSIHFHVWDVEAMFEMFVYARRELKIPLRVKTMLVSGHEVIFLLQKSE